MTKNLCKLNLIFVSSVSACFCWDNDLPYNTDASFVARIKGNIVFNGNTNVFSVFELVPDTDYVLTVDGTDVCLRFRTLSETVCYNVADFGAKADGVSDDTNAVQIAINCLPKNGRLFFPEGKYYVRPLTLKSNITIHLAENAVILGCVDMDSYPLVPGEVSDFVSRKKVQVGTWEGNPVSMKQSLLFGEHLVNVKIVGRGCIDGNAQNSQWWRDVKNLPFGRPRLVFLNGCKNVWLHGVTAQNSASWQMHPYFCKNVNFLDIFVKAPKDSPNTDAIDPECCDGVSIIGCRFSVGDDCIAIKSGKAYIGKTYKTPAKNTVIDNCLMQFGHGAVTLGSEMAGGVKNLTVKKCRFEQTDRGLRIKTRRGRGKYAVVDNVTFENIRMDGVKTPIVINMWYNCCDPDRFSEYNTIRQKLPVDERTPHLGRFCFKNMVCENCHVSACYCDGLPEKPIDSVMLQNIRFGYAQNAESGYPSMKNDNVALCRAGLRFFNVKNLVIDNVFAEGCDGAPLVAENVQNISCYNDIRRFVDRILEESTADKPLWNIEHYGVKKEKWNYIDGCMLTALLQLWKITGDNKYFDFVEKFVDHYVADDGSLLGYDKSNYNLDDINEGRVLFDLYEKTGKQKYAEAIALLKSQLDEQPRTTTGNFWHKQIYPNQVWLDGVYMAQVFSAMWNMQNGGYISDVVGQIENVAKLMKDTATGLYYHGCDCSKTAFWCDKNTGLSQSFWLRSIGWFLVALADICEICGDKADEITVILQDALHAVAKFVDKKTNMLYQVVDCPDKKGNYPETSGSAMVAYAMLKAARLKIVPAKFAKIGQGIFDGICRTYLSEQDGKLNLGGICLVAGLGPESNRRRDGTFEYYVSEPVVQNDAKGLAPFVLCYTEITRLFN